MWGEADFVCFVRSLSESSAWSPKVPAKLGMFCCKELSHCDTLHADLGFTADLKGGKRKDLAAVIWL